MNVINEKELNLLQLSKRDIKVMVNGNSPLKSKYTTSGVTFIKPKTMMDEHTHKDEEEIIYILKGKGFVIIDKVKEAIKKGTMILIPKNKPHYIDNKSNEEMKFVFFFTSFVEVGGYDIAK